MRLIDVYNDMFIKYKDYVILIKSGSFYETFNEGAYVLNNLLGYKIKELKCGKRVGFPLVSLNKVINVLCQKKINYIVFEEEVKEKKKFNKNNFSSFLSDIDLRIENIYISLKKMKGEKYFNFLLKEIEELL